MSLCDRLEEHAVKTVIMSIIINYISKCNYFLLLLTCTVVDIIWIVTSLFALIGPRYQWYARGCILYDRESVSCKHVYSFIWFPNPLLSVAFISNFSSRVCFRWSALFVMYESPWLIVVLL